MNEYRLSGPYNDFLKAVIEGSGNANCPEVLGTSEYEYFKLPEGSVLDNEALNCLMKESNDAPVYVVAEVDGEDVAYRFTRDFIEKIGSVILVQDFNKDGCGYGPVGERWNSSSYWFVKDVINGVKSVYIKKATPAEDNK